MRKSAFTFVNILIVTLLVSLAGVNIFLLLREDRKIAYVRSYDLINKYQGTLEARADFEKKKTSLMSNVDSLRMDFERAKNQYISNARGMAQEKRAEQEKILGQQQNQLVQYSEAIDQKIQEEDSKMMQEVLNQINSFVEEYALREDYDIVLGTTLSGNLLFGAKSLDVTDQVLIELNNRYKGK